jgi:hypothetical protein
MVVIHNYIGDWNGRYPGQTFIRQDVVCIIRIERHQRDRLPCAVERDPWRIGRAKIIS